MPENEIVINISAKIFICQKLTKQVIKTENTHTPCQYEISTE